jgi:hypothetical protein
MCYNKCYSLMIMILSFGRSSEFNMNLLKEIEHEGMLSLEVLDTKDCVITKDDKTGITSIT